MVVYAVICFLVLSFASYALAVTSSPQFWSTSSSFNLQLWPAVVATALSALLLSLSLIGGSGLLLLNKPLTLTYAAALAVATCVFFVLGVVCVVYAALPHSNTQVDGRSPRV